MKRIVRGIPRIPNHRAPNHPLTIMLIQKVDDNSEVRSKRPKKQPTLKSKLFSSLGCMDGVHLDPLGSHRPFNKNHAVQRVLEFWPTTGWNSGPNWHSNKPQHRNRYLQRKKDRRWKAGDPQGGSANQQRCIIELERVMFFDNNYVISTVKSLRFRDGKDNKG